jgi:plasmid stability protein
LTAEVRVAIHELAEDNLQSMKTITLHEVSDALLHKLEARAAANHRSLEDEALFCLLAAVESDDETINSVQPGRWAEIEQSVCDTIHDRGTPLTEADIERYRGMARGDAGS